MATQASAVKTTSRPPSPNDAGLPQVSSLTQQQHLRFMERPQDQPLSVTSITVSEASLPSLAEDGIPITRVNTLSTTSTTFSGVDNVATTNGQHTGRQTHTGFLERMFTNTSILVPRRKRRGLLANLCLIPEIERPIEYKRPIKYIITIVIALAGASAPMASTVMFPALTDIANDLGATQTTTNLSVAMYMLGMAVFPLWWSSFAERIGYRTIFLVSFALYTIANVCGAMSVNIAMLVIFRITSGSSAASAQTIGAGVIASIWEVKERGRAMGYFYLGPLCGPLLAPIIGGTLTQRFGWRGTQWFLAIFGATLCALLLFVIPETLDAKAKDMKPMPNSLPSEKADANASGNSLERPLSRVSPRTVRRGKEWIVALKILLIDPLRSLTYMRFPPVLLTVYWASMTFGCLYVLNVSLQTTFSREPYNFPVYIVGLLYIPGSLGYVISSVVGGKWNDIVMRKAAVERKRRAMESQESGIDKDSPLEYRPEDRMGLNAWVAGTLYPVALIWYGWTADQGAFWVVPMVAMFCFGLGSMLVFSMATTMLTEFVPGRSSSAVAVNNFFRNIFSCIGGVVAEPIIRAIGNGWLFTILGIMGLLSTSVVWIMHRNGPKWRARADQYEFL